MTIQPMSGTARARMWQIVRERATRVVTVPVRVVAIERVSISYSRVTLQGSGLTAYIDPKPADAFKLSLPGAPGAAVPLPTYRDGQTHWPGGSIEPIIRAYTVRHAHPAGTQITFDILDHPGGAGPTWLQSARPGDGLTISGFRIDFAESEEAGTVVVVADPSALPAAATIIEGLAGRKRVLAVIEAPHDDDRGLVDDREGVDLIWADHAGTALLDAVRSLDLPDHGVQAWVAGESGMVKVVRWHLLHDRHLIREEVHAAGYWRDGRTGQEEFDDSLTRFSNAIAAGEDVSDPDVLQRWAFDASEVSG